MIRDRAIEKERSISREKELLQAKEIEKAYHDLKLTQAQLIQSEKMASLGELTAGIAYEIQNPLNFINNFSEVSNELMQEMQEELTKGDIEEARFIADGIKQNLDKINHHGKRAEAIVKGMSTTLVAVLEVRARFDGALGGVVSVDPPVLLNSNQS